MQKYVITLTCNKFRYSDNVLISSSECNVDFPCAITIKMLVKDNYEIINPCLFRKDFYCHFSLLSTRIIKSQKLTKSCENHHKKLVKNYAKKESP